MISIAVALAATFILFMVARAIKISNVKRAETKRVFNVHVDQANRELVVIDPALTRYGYR